MNQFWGRIVINSGELVAMLLCNSLGITSERLSSDYIKRLPENLDLTKFKGLLFDNKGEYIELKLLTSEKSETNQLSGERHITYFKYPDAINKKVSTLQKLLDTFSYLCDKFQMTYSGEGKSYQLLLV